MSFQLIQLIHALRARVNPRTWTEERGDVPGWVLITLMTAGLVVALWIVAEPKLSSLLQNALNISGDPNK